MCLFAYMMRQNGVLELVLLAGASYNNKDSLNQHRDLDMH